MQEAMANAVRERAGKVCEYCKLAQYDSSIPFEIDHIIAQKHRGATTSENLALSCFYCNSFKGPNIAGRDRRTKQLVPLFNPRRHRWSRHLRWDGATVVGRTAIGRVTVAILNMNGVFLLRLREELIGDGLLPPTAPS